jgi:hypothetical protein
VIIVASIALFLILAIFAYAGAEAIAARFDLDALAGRVGARLAQWFIGQ